MRVSGVRGVIVVGVAAVLVAGCDLGSAAVVHPAPSRLVDVVDVNADGALDVVAVGPGASQILLNDGSGGLSGDRVTVDEEITAFAVADIDGDGSVDRVDVTHTQAGSTSLLVARGDGGGGFGTQEVLVAEADSTMAADVDALDLEGDGDRDVVLGGLYGATVFHNDGAGNLTRGDHHLGALCGSPGSGGYFPVTITEVMHADIDRDGDDDIVTTGVCEWAWGPAPGVWLFHNDGAGGASRGTGIGMTGDRALVGLSVADVDEDGNLDFIAGNPGTSSVDVIRGAGNGYTLTGRVTVATPAPPGDLEVADIDDDGHVDLVVTDAGAGLARVLYGSGTGTFPESHVLATGGDVVGPVAVGDIDGDGSADVVFGNDGGTADSSVAVLRNTLDGRQH